MKKRVAAAAAVCVLGTAVVWANSGGTPPAVPADISKLALQTVTAERVQRVDWQQGFTANGSIAAWHEAIVGSELGGLRLVQVNVNVGDRVTRGQVLAHLFSDGVAAELVQQQGALEEARAALAEAQENAAGARTLLSSGAMSTQQSTQYLTQERSARARVTSAEARVKMEQIRLSQTAIVAQDDGVISARSASVGAVAGQGQELFRLIRQGRLEWRAEVSANELNRIKPGQAATLRATNGETLEGHVRAVAPSVDPQSRNALVYVDLPAGSPVRAGMFASGQFSLGSSEALTLPQGAVVTRDGISYV
ncbi:MAG: efflux RND transporter periplasmic adaptor subunit, partial [Rubrivivax sp.]